MEALKGSALPSTLFGGGESLDPLVKPRAASHYSIAKRTKKRAIIPAILRGILRIVGSADWAKLANQRQKSDAKTQRRGGSGSGPRINTDDADESR